MSQLVIGQKLWYVSGSVRLGTGEEVVVTKVGRKWATVGNGWNAFQIDRETLRANTSVGVPGRCYLSKEGYEAGVKKDTAWEEFRQSLDHLYQTPKGLTTERIWEIHKEIAEASTK